PVVVNGDIDSPEAARRALAASGAAGVMVGRAMQGRPWLAAQIGDALAGRPPRPGPVGRAFGEMAAGHYEDMLAHYGRALGLRVARKHVGWYLDEVGAPADLRRALLTAGDPGQVLRALAALERPGPGRERAAA
ncbi:MAG: tRNA dihydrouridine synthase DusB, partial [Alphaproteobacteria bacterium]